MLRDITIGQHFPGNSILHTMDPRVKLLLTIAYIVMLFVGSNPAGLVISIDHSRSSLTRLCRESARWDTIFHSLFG